MKSIRFSKTSKILKTHLQFLLIICCSLPVPFISSSVQSKLAIRAVILNDEALLQSLICDVDRVCSVKMTEMISFLTIILIIFIGTY